MKKQILDAFSKSQSISFISRKFDVQPIPTAKMILLTHGYHRVELKSIFSVSNMMKGSFPIEENGLSSEKGAQEDQSKSKRMKHLLQSSIERKQQLVQKVQRNPNILRMIQQSMVIDTFIEDEHTETIEGRRFETTFQQLLQTIGFSRDDFYTETDLTSKYSSERTHYLIQDIGDAESVLNANDNCKAGKENVYTKISLLTHAEHQTEKKKLKEQKKQRPKFTNGKSGTNNQPAIVDEKQLSGRDQQGSVSKRLRTVGQNATQEKGCGQDMVTELITLPGEFETKYQGRTPDILFLDGNQFVIETFVDGHSQLFPVNWIDCKNFVGGVSDFLDKKVFSQAEAYNRLFGSGLVVFSLGFTASFEATVQHKGLNDKVRFLHIDTIEQLQGCAIDD